MISFQLLAHAEKKAPDNPLKSDPPPLLHQMRTYEALKQFDIVMNVYATGTGKTVASLLHLFHIDRTGKNVLFIAPTNALLDQHATDIEEFVIKHGLDFRVERVTAAAVRRLDPEERPGRVLHQLIRNYLQYETDAIRRRPLILVVNPDIFYYAVFARYGPHDRRNLLEDFLLRFDYIVIDEFHYYDSKQLANFLFVLALFDQFGYFSSEDHQRRVCLLSATPGERVRQYLDRLFPRRWVLLSPDNESPESVAYPTISSLAPITVTLEENDLTAWASDQREQLQKWVNAGQDGAIISSSLWRVNHAYQTLRSVLPESELGRITGPEPSEARRLATARSLILASPTVDIGYNFKKMKKERQNVDFVVCDARYRDELLQRLGRAGRVLGKTETGTASQAVALLPGEALLELQELDGQTLDRLSFARRINNCEALPEKHTLTNYIRSHAITECFRPIFELGRILPPAMHNELEALFKQIRETFAPGSGWSYQGLKGFFFKYEKRQRWLHATQEEIAAGDATAEHVADWLEWQYPEQSKPDLGEIRPHLPAILAGEENRRTLRAFVKSQVAITEALFNFRDAFQGPRAVVHDPQHLLSSETMNVYDLFHLLRHYNLSPPVSRPQFQRQFGETHLKGDFYFKLLGWREEKISIEFAYTSPDLRDDFERKWCRRPIGFSGLELRARDADGNLLAGGLTAEIVAALSDETIVALILLPQDAGARHARLRGTTVWPRRLTVHFPDGATDDEYSIFLGKNAFIADAELRSHFLMQDRMNSKAIIL